MKADLEKLISPQNAPGPAKARYEIKYVLTGAYVPLAREWLEHHCAPDPKFVHNMIHSLYFDTPARALFDRKVESDFLKWKIRLRWYSDETQRQFSETAFLELKKKEGHLGSKVRVPLTVDVARLHQDPFGFGDSLDLLEHIDVHALGCGLHFAPLAVIRYCRRRYIDMISSSRIALDSEIGVSRANENDALRQTSCQLAQAVLEVKGPHAHELPATLYALQTLTGAHKQSFSKYGECLKLLLR